MKLQPPPPPPNKMHNRQGKGQEASNNQKQTKQPSNKEQQSKQFGRTLSSFLSATFSHFQQQEATSIQSEPFTHMPTAFSVIIHIYFESNCSPASFIFNLATFLVSVVTLVIDRDTVFDFPERNNLVLTS